MRLLTAIAFALLLPTATLAQSREVTLTGGMPTPVPGTDITLQLTDVQDGRCPPGLSCVWEGEYTAEIAVLSGGGSVTGLTISNALDERLGIVPLGDHTLTLVRLTPNRDALAALGRPVLISDYTLTLTVSP